MQELSFSFEELLDRAPLTLGPDLSAASLEDKAVLITGAGGSIGSSLCRRILCFAPSHIILLDKSENDLYQTDLELRTEYSGARLTAVLGDIAESMLLERVLDLYQPQIVLHAAAYKHVPLMELNPCAAVQNNVIATYKLVLAITRHGAERLVMLSTDKAVNARSIMGASKRIAEFMLQHMGGPGSSKLTSVRLGNVLGTRGSVVPRFIDQIRRRKAVTVTHPDASRYFLTPAEAADLVLAATWLGIGGDILVPEAGEPIRIVDLAEKLIGLAGLVPQSDIPVVFTGLRPGEKLVEELLAYHESFSAIDGYDIRRVVNRTVDQVGIGRWINEVTEAVHSNDIRALIDRVHEIAPEYRPSKQLIEGSSLRPAADQVLR